jgi:hypothetical protein
MRPDGASRILCPFAEAKGAHQHQDRQRPHRQYSLTKGDFIMSQIAALTAANALPQNALPLIQGAAAPQAQGNASPTPASQDTVSISSEAKELQGHEK